MRLWELVLSSWRDVTGESKIKPTDGLVVLFGDRSGTWLDEAEQAEFAGLEEPFAVIHKITLHTILQERNRDAAPKAKQRRSPTVLFQKVQHVVQRVASYRWGQARRQQPFDQGHAMAAFRKRWEAPGIAVIGADEQAITIILFMRKEVREQWHRSSKGTGHYRSQQHAPPADLPPLTNFHLLRWLSSATQDRPTRAAPSFIARSHWGGIEVRMPRYTSGSRVGTCV